jgi:hypothetical protein
MKALPTDDPRTFALPSAFVLCLTALLGCDATHPCVTVLTAQLYDSTRACLEQSMTVGCTEATGCDDSLTWAVNAQARCFFFTNRCVPAGFTIVESNDSRCPAASFSLPTCVSR